MCSTKFLQAFEIRKFDKKSGDVVFESSWCAASVDLLFAFLVERISDHPC